MSGRQQGGGDAALRVPRLPGLRRARAVRQGRRGRPVHRGRRLRHQDGREQLRLPVYEQPRELRRHLREARGLVRATCYAACLRSHHPCASNNHRGRPPDHDDCAACQVAAFRADDRADDCAHRALAHHRADDDHHAADHAPHNRVPHRHPDDAGGMRPRLLGAHGEAECQAGALHLQRNGDLPPERGRPERRRLHGGRQGGRHGRQPALRRGVPIPARLRRQRDGGVEPVVVADGGQHPRLPLHGARRLRPVLPAGRLPLRRPWAESRRQLVRPGRRRRRHVPVVQQRGHPAQVPRRHPWLEQDGLLHDGTLRRPQGRPRADALRSGRLQEGARGALRRGVRLGRQMSGRHRQAGVHHHQPAGLPDPGDRDHRRARARLPPERRRRPPRPPARLDGGADPGPGDHHHGAGLQRGRVDHLLSAGPGRLHALLREERVDGLAGPPAGGPPGPRRGGHGHVPHGHHGGPQVRDVSPGRRRRGAEADEVGHRRYPVLLEPGLLPRQAGGRPPRLQRAGPHRQREHQLPGRRGRLADAGAGHRRPARRHCLLLCAAGVGLHSQRHVGCLAGAREDDYAAGALHRGRAVPDGDDAGRRVPGLPTLRRRQGAASDAVRHRCGDLRLHCRLLRGPLRGRRARVQRAVPLRGRQLDPGGGPGGRLGDPRPEHLHAAGRGRPGLHRQPVQQLRPERRQALVAQVAGPLEGDQPRGACARAGVVPDLHRRPQLPCRLEDACGRGRRGWHALLRGEHQVHLHAGLLHRPAGGGAPHVRGGVQHGLGGERLQGRRHRLADARPQHHRSQPGREVPVRPLAAAAVLLPARDPLQSGRVQPVHRGHAADVQSGWICERHRARELLLGVQDRPRAEPQLGRPQVEQAVPRLRAERCAEAGDDVRPDSRSGHQRPDADLRRRPV
mmetsp:Transcript_24100/g.63583  ORF Transcript_24100/g.63583 Transcript_24100/m.63583 type:complete len:908 (-) Transcript_24100:1795-4518(-)